ncbi:hypothetical protein UA08_05810 [Talaromyces atroroseus]|uniref:Uncharacterized protein n=1 Tax=Talaromyces atroroseus TaxID=1441469 RepID=A0A225B057_TALAT|nr:hypothetical protein UA08_05810 [Talaromyces atroroseus]OKL59167.1 hypothetical protein UA08_05810 [Talaromyces atroroseus]
MVYTILALSWSNLWQDTQTGTPYYRNLIYTPNRETADLLFRILKQYGPQFAKSKMYIFKRASPQVWIWNRYDGNYIPLMDALKEAINEISNGLAPIKDEYKDRLRGRISIDYRGSYNQNDTNVPPIPHLDMPDHITGGVFSIRDKSQPQRYWAKRTAFPGEESIELSTCRKSRFRIAIKGNSDSETVMIFDDEVFLELIEWSKDGLKSLPINIDSSNGLLKVLEAGAEHKTFPFGKLLGGGFIRATHYQDDHTEYPTWIGDKFDGGDSWELCY